ncbi:rhodanese-like domain-containing protein [Pararobbsia silviterrae]|uniref:Rhodanese-like domain-containing protein n=1 Tax=Pararobbsia silviterrae TaxID=1792498 RepID=A0A494XKQ1_9BURK|nr:rhodanese-like domain-containing protein [Pararobbsia silviterrae]RKP50311.1 rhodanese-like domain-containing protein [Pararobbsia silviterrae]
MTSLDPLYAKADQRRTEGGLAYAGALSPAESLEFLTLEPNARLVDVRTRAELDWVGRPQVPAEQYVHIEWIRYPGSIPNAEFIEQLRAAAQPDTPLLFLCRSAARSKLAAVAASNAGFTKAYDLLEGFEGDKDATGHRKTVSGWCFRGLPWIGA